MQDLCTLGGPDSDELLINERRQIAGLSITTIDLATHQPTVDPFLWENGKMIDLGTLGGVSGYPNMINGQGQIVGFSDVAGGPIGHAIPFEVSVFKGLRRKQGNHCNARGICKYVAPTLYLTMPA